MSKLNSAITKWGVAASLLALPEFLKVAFGGDIPVETISIAATAGSHAMNNLNNSIAQIIQLIVPMSYLAGVGLGISGALDFKSYGEEGPTYRKQESKKPQKKEVPKPVVLEKKEDVVDTGKIISNLAEITKYTQESFIKVISKINKEEEDFPLNFKNAELNGIVKDIQEKVAYLKAHDFVKKDVESLFMVEKTESEYLNKIYTNYMNVPEKKRGKKGLKDSPYELTFNQLNLLLKGLDEIENKIVQDSLMSQKANEIFLKEKVANI